MEQLPHHSPTAVCQRVFVIKPEKSVTHSCTVCESAYVNENPPFSNAPQRGLVSLHPHQMHGGFGLLQSL